MSDDIIERYNRTAERTQHNALIKRLRGEGWFWTYSLDYDCKLCRTLVKGSGCNDYLDCAPLDLPIHQIVPLPV